MPRALVVDDSKAVRMILAKTLRDLGYEVQEASNGHQALEIAERERASLQLALVDWNMPQMNGLELVALIRQRPELSSLIVVMVTTETEVGQMAAALEAGANEYVMKPFTKDILLEKLQMVGIHR